MALALFIIIKEENIVENGSKIEWKEEEFFIIQPAK